MSKTSELNCQNCGEVFEARRNDAKFCPACRTTGVYMRSRNPVCPCGNSVGSGSLNRKYCSSSCRKQYGLSGKTFGGRKTAVCQGCGEEFSRPRSFPSKMKFCSNACAKRGIIQGRFAKGLIVGGNVILFQSTWELRFAAACERAGITYFRYDGPGFETSEGTYRPDFIIERDGESQIVEVKGYMDDISVTKISETLAKGIDIWVVTKEVLERFETDLVIVKS